ncbi:PKD domain-containing protein [Pontibacter sp. G13]|uniref:PKD domain-containing protein n=1 Tax=Pontibacter sp. G13 TaxID=3074898 RepID=UPI00288C4411|nr:PKD domain-containing protein [Pontibacter sp. G13]WNJ19845.1 PKD domain-containing protein [Pontibacter sp. G13]
MKRNMGGWITLLIWIWIFSPLSAQPIAQFQGDVLSGCAPLVVNFQSLSQGATAWHWISDGNEAFIEHPTFLYTEPGTYSVTLIVQDANGVSDTLIQTAYIVIHDQPAAAFAVDVESACTHEVITFTDQSSSNSSNIVSYLWDFGDGITAQGTQVQHTYSQSGTYPVSLVVTNAAGCLDQHIEPAYIQIHAPDPSFAGAPRIACGPPLAVSFSQSAGSGVQHFWDFGDGTQSSQATPTHTYQTFGTFDVQHITVDGNGCRDTLKLPHYVSLGINNLSIYAEDSTLCLGDSMRFHTNASANSTVIWDFGDGDSAVGLDPVHLYDSAGKYEVSAYLFDASGCEVSLAFEVEIFEAPEVDFEAFGPTTGCQRPFLVSFNNQTTGATSYLWNFGDGQLDTVFAPHHAFLDTGSFSVKLVATGPGGCQSSKRIKDMIRIEDISAGFLPDKIGGCAPLTVAFMDTSTSPLPITQWNWDFGDGTSYSGGPNPVHTYLDTGLHYASLQVSTSNGCWDTVTFEYAIGVGLTPQADFEADTLISCALTTIEFQNQSTNANSYLWIFGDGDTARAESPSHGFSALGPVDVTLIAFQNGCADTLYKPNYVHILAPLPLMSVSDKLLCEFNETVEFKNTSSQYDYFEWTLNGQQTFFDTVFTHNFQQSTGIQHIDLFVSNDQTGCELLLKDSLIIQPIEAAFSVDTNRFCVPEVIRFYDESDDAIWWKWEFGQGDSSLHQNPKRKFRFPGSYPVTLRVMNAIGCRDSYTYESLEGLQVLAGMEITGDGVGCAPLDIQLDDQSSGTGAIVSWEWDLGDGTTQQVPSFTHTYSAEDVYDIQLTVTDADGCVDSVKQEGAVFATLPRPDFSIHPKIQCQGEPVGFVSLSAGTGLSYLWDFGDGATSTLANPQHIYQQDGTYDITLTVTDIHGCDSTIYQNQAVQISPIFAAFEADTTYASCPPLTVQFTSGGQFPHAGIQWIWDFGDGATGSSPNPQHVYTQPGLYDVSLIVRTPDGCIDSMVQAAYIEVEGPTASFSYDPSKACPGTAIQFEADSEFPISYDWIFGDAETASGAQVSHIYHEPGIYLPILVIEDSSGCKVFTSNPDTLEIFQPPVAQISYDLMGGCDTAWVEFEDQSQTPSILTSWEWSLGDGTSSTLQHPSHHFASPGAYPIQLMVEDARGCRDTVSIDPALVVYPLPHPQIVASQDSGCSPVNYQAYVDLGNHPSDQTNIEWYFQQQLLATGPTLNYQFDQAGTYLIEVRVEDEFGCMGTAARNLVVHPLPPVDFMPDKIFGCAPWEVSWVAPSADPSIQYQWEMGDGHSPSGAVVEHTYLEDGSYHVSLEGTNAFGCKAYKFVPKAVSLQHPLAFMEIYPPIACPGDEVFFSGQAESRFPVVGWEWQFGTNDTFVGQSVPYAFTESGTYPVTLVITDSIGCRDTLVEVEGIEIVEDVQPDLVKGIRVSVKNATQISIQWEQADNSRLDFAQYELFRQDATGTWESIAVVDRLNQTQYVDQVPTTESGPICYRILTTNACGTVGDADQAAIHCSMDLQANGTTAGNELSWTPYQGFSISEYHIYKVRNYGQGGAQFLAKVACSESSYVDSTGFCYERNQYRILAIGNNRLESWSDTARAISAHEPPTIAANITQVTVEKNTFLQISAQAQAVEFAHLLVIERGNGTSFQQVHQTHFTTDEYIWQDHQVDIQQQTYAYRTFVLDSCGDYTPLGQTGNNILLHTKQQSGEVFLQWNPYDSWEAGTEYLELEVAPRPGAPFETLAILPGDQPHYSDTRIDPESGMACYRITAYQRDGKHTSRSNESCISLTPQLFTPNAFSPNGDGLNDRFSFQGIFTDITEMTIFNRWGEEIFRTNHSELGWDGMDQHGMPAPEGVYIYHISGFSTEGTATKRMGSITLIR